MRRAKHPPTLLLLLMLGACVTINIYFPEAAAEQAADRIIQDILGTPSPQERASRKTPNDQSFRQHEVKQVLQRTTRGVLNIVLTPAYAQQADLTISSPAIDKIRASMKARHPQLEPYYKSGAIGLTRNALVAVRDLKAIPLKERNPVKQWEAAENRDRNALYREIAIANGHPEWEDNIRQTFARRWVANARSGWWYQDSAGVWQQQ